MAVVVRSTEPLHVVAVALNCWVLGVLETKILALVGDMSIRCMQPTVTVSVAVPLMDGFWVPVAVIVVEPVLTEVANPEALIVAKLVSELVHVTGGLPVLPSLKVPKAVYCWVLPVLPV